MVQNVPAPYVVEENFGGYFHDHDDLALVEELQDQVGVLHFSFVSLKRIIGRYSCSWNVMQKRMHLGEHGIYKILFSHKLVELDYLLNR